MRRRRTERRDLESRNMCESNAFHRPEIKNPASSNCEKNTFDSFSSAPLLALPTLHVISAAKSHGMGKSSSRRAKNTLELDSNLMRTSRLYCTCTWTWRVHQSADARTSTGAFKCAIGKIKKNKKQKTLCLMPSALDMHMMRYWVSEWVHYYWSGWPLLALMHLHNSLD